MFLKENHRSINFPTIIFRKSRQKGGEVSSNTPDLQVLFEKNFRDDLEVAHG